MSFEFYPDKARNCIVFPNQRQHQYASGCWGYSLDQLKDLDAVMRTGKRVLLKLVDPDGEVKFVVEHDPNLLEFVPQGKSGNSTSMFLLDPNDCPAHYDPELVGEIEHAEHTR